MLLTVRKFIMVRSVKYIVFSFCLANYFINTICAQDVKKFDFDRIEDNSFLIEEAYNQDPGVIQHISNFLYLKQNTWIYTFTDEWPVPGMTLTRENNANTKISNTLLINPGFRYAINFKSGLQIVPGIAIPIGIGSSEGEFNIFAYLSFEHPLWKPKPCRKTQVRTNPKNGNHL